MSKNRGSRRPRGRLLLINDRMYRHENGRYSTDSSYILFFEPLRKCFEKVSVLGCVRDGGRTGALPVEGFDVHHWPPYSSIREFWVRWAWRRRELRAVAVRAMAEADVVWLTLNHAAGPFLYGLARKMAKPVVLEVVDDAVSSVRQTQRYVGWHRTAALALSSWYDRQTRRMVHRTPSLLLGADLMRRYASPSAPHAEFFENLLEEGDLRSRPVRPSEPPCRLLFVGRMVPMKAVELLLQAALRLQARGTPVLLRLVGDGPLRQSLGRMADELGLNPRPVFLGHLPFGSAVAEHYDWADILVLPSRGGEGVPRVLLEGMAHGVGLVATSVCGIPTVVRHRGNGLLVPPGEPAALAEAIAEMWADGALRGRLVAQGEDFVRNHTRLRQLSEALGFLQRCYPDAPLPECVA